MFHREAFTDSTIFSAVVTNPPGTGTMTLTFLNKTTSTVQNVLTSYPDSLRLRIKCTGGVPTNSYVINVKGNGPNGTPVHMRTVTTSVITGTADTTAKFLITSIYIRIILTRLIQAQI